jgi:hypothetical protein
MLDKFITLCEQHPYWVVLASVVVLCFSLFVIMFVVWSIREINQMDNVDYQIDKLGIDEDGNLWDDNDVNMYI